MISKYFSGSMLVILMLTIVACGGNQESKKKQSKKAMSETDQSKQTEMAEAPKEKLNINTASEEAFRTIPGVGDKMVHEFKEYRPYVSIQQFRKEIGKYVDEEQVAAYEKFIFVPVSANDSDAASLQQLPGIDADKAKKLVEGRPYDSKDAFVKKLSSMLNEEQLATAKAYIESSDSE